MDRYNTIGAIGIVLVPSLGIVAMSGLFLIAIALFLYTGDSTTLPPTH